MGRFSDDDMPMAHSIDEQFDDALSRYQAGESTDTLIPTFKGLCEQAPKNSAIYTCLSWLYLLADKPNAAYKAAQKAIKIMPQDPQAHINIAIAILDSGRKGVREHVELASQLVMSVEEVQADIRQNFKEGLTRKPDWDSLKRVEKWIFES
ncbi:MAG: tetratricopeptide repeat protein [Leptolyngbyaceae cyanobacterium]